MKTFVVAFEEANFTKAAQRLNATQPGVSVQIAALEADVGMQLFDRNTRSVTPTLAGKHLYPRAIQLIRDLNRATQEIRSLCGTATGRVSVGIPPTLSKAILAPVLSRYLEVHPQIDVRVIEAYDDTLLALIESQELDFALLTRAGNHAAVDCRRIFCDRFVLASGALAGLEPNRPIRLDVEPFRKIVVPSLLSHAGVLDEPLRTRRIVPARLIEMDGLSGLLEFLAATDWVALLSAATAHGNSKRSSVRFNPIAGNEISIDYFVAYARIQPVSIAARAFIDLATAELERVATHWPTGEPGASHRRKSRPARSQTA